MKIKELFYEYPFKDDRNPEWRKKRYARVWFDVLRYGTAILIAGVALVGALGFLSWKLDKYDCNVFEKNTGIETKYKNFACYANYKGDWVEKDNIILTIEGNK